MEINGRKVVNASIDGVHKWDYPDFCDAYFESAEYEDTGDPLTDKELEKLTNEYGDVINRMAHEKMWG
jgi:hypothetical protein